MTSSDSAQYTEAVRDALNQFATELNSDASIVSYVLIDGAKLENPFEKLQNSGIEWTALLEGADSIQNCAYGAILAKWPFTTPQAAALETEILHSPLASWLWSPLSLPQLQKHLAAFSSTHLMDAGVDVVLRYYDPIIMADWMQVWANEQKKELFAPVVAWRWLDACRQWQSVQRGDVPMQDKIATKDVQLSAKQEGNIELLSISGMVLETIVRQHPDWLQHYAPTTHFAVVRELLRVSRSFGDQTMSDHFAYLAVALNCHPNLHQHPDIAQQLALKKSRKISQIARNLSDEEFNTIRTELHEKIPLANWQAQSGSAWEKVQLNPLPMLQS